MNKNESLITTENPIPNFPAFVEAEKMFEKFAAITKETASKAYNFFLERGSELGNQVEDWLRAEAETLRTAPVKITNTKNMVNVAIAIPGFKPEEIEVSVIDDMLIVSGETTTEEKKEDEETFYSEWSSNKFLRKLSLPSEVQTKNVDAQLKDGILTLALKKKAVEKAAKVAVKAA